MTDGAPYALPARAIVSRTLGAGAHAQAIEHYVPMEEWHLAVRCIPECYQREAKAQLKFLAARYRAMRDEPPP